MMVRARVPAIVTAAVLAVLTLTGCSLLEAATNETPRNRSGQVVKGGDADVFTVRVGDCLNDTEADEVVTVPIVPCDQEHDFEAYSSFQLADGGYPGEDAIFERGDAQCRADFAEFVGVDWEASELDFRYFYPTEESWSSGDREVLCLLFDPDGTVDASLQQARR